MWKQGALFIHPLTVEVGAFFILAERGWGGRETGMGREGLMTFFRVRTWKNRGMAFHPCTSLHFLRLSRCKLQLDDFTTRFLA
jgi:hypothetical protein